ncbi:MAG: fumarylacetoacetate hydrolase family protein [Anaerolineae bacterium]|nr:fumarylacetoacetate hydrolase family protein [Anaerolineae bacterium]
MILLTFKKQGTYVLGIKTDAGVIDVGASSQSAPATVDALLAQGQAGLNALESLAANVPADSLLDEASLEIGPCVPNPGKILCVGLNYRRHAAESGMDVPKTPVLFSKFNNALAAPGEEVPLSDAGVQYDYEAELVVVIGKQAKNVSEEEALDYVFGYCNGDDVSARDLQFVSSQWLLGKTLDKFMPIGPYLVTGIADPQTLSIRCWLNGELRQDSNTADMVFNVAQVISYASRYMTLYPGDIISTGTPEGVIMGLPEKNWLKPGDEVTVEVEGLGRLTNTMCAG